MFIKGFQKISNVFEDIVTAPKKCIFFYIVTGAYLNLIIFCNYDSKHVVLDQNHAHSCLFSIISKNILKKSIESMIFIDFLKTSKFLETILKPLKILRQTFGTKVFGKFLKTQPVKQRISKFF